MVPSNGIRHSRVKIYEFIIESQKFAKKNFDKKSEFFFVEIPFSTLFCGLTVCNITSHFPIMSQRKLDAIILGEGGNEREREFVREREGVGESGRGRRERECGEADFY